MREEAIAEEFREAIPRKLFKFLKILWEKQYHPYFVGGSVRDFILLGKIPTDIDIEVHSLVPMKEVQRSENWQQLKLILSESYELEEVAYEILKVKVGEYEVELSPPRIEEFENHLTTHHNFNCRLFSRLSVSEAFKRRDFTINAMSVLIESESKSSFIDPFGGLYDLKNRELKACSNDFVKDPVRFLRAIRFYFRFGFRLNPTLQHMLEMMDLTGISHFYVWREGIKSGRFFLFLRKIAQVSHQLPQNLATCLLSIKEQEEKLDDWFSRLLRYFPKEEKERIIFLVLGLDNLISSQSKREFCSYFQTSFKSVEKIESLKRLVRSIFNHEEAVKLFQIENEEFSSFSDEFLKALLQLKSLLETLNWPRNEKADKELLEEIEMLIKPEFYFEAKNAFFLFWVLRNKIQVSDEVYQKEKIAPNQRSLFQIYQLLKKYYA